MSDFESKPLTADDPRLTAYVLGELEGEELQWVKQAVRADPALQFAAEEIRRTVGMLGEALAMETGQGRDRARRVAGGRASGREHRRSHRRPFRISWYIVIGGLAAACFAVIVEIRRARYEEAGSAQEGRRAISLSVVSSDAGDSGPGSAVEAPAENYLPVTPVFSGAEVPDRSGFIAVKDGAEVAVPLASEDEGYARVRRLIAGGKLPQPGAVPISDLVNAFAYDRASADKAPLTARVESGVAPWAPNHVLVRVQVDAREPLAIDRPPTTLMVLADIPPEPQQQARLDSIRENLRLLVKRLRPDDRFGIVAWTGEARVELEPTSLADRGAVQAAIDNLGVRSGRRVSDALVTTLELAHGDAAGRGSTWRVLICSDGASLPVAEESRALDLLENSETLKAFSRAIWGPAPGDRDLISRLAAQGHAKEAVISGSTDAQQVIAGLIADPIRVAATDASLRLSFDPSKVASYRILGYGPGGGALGATKGGELLEGQSSTTLVEIVPKGIAARGAVGLVKVSLRYNDPDADQNVARTIEAPAPVAWAESSADFKFSAAVAGFGLALEERPMNGAVAYLDRVQRWAREGAGTVPAADRSEFMGLLHSAREIVR